MKNQIWKELQVTPEEEKLAQEIRDGGVGNRLSPEQMAEFQVREETDVEIDTRVGKTLVHLYFPEESEGPLPLFVNIHGGGFIKGRRDQDIVFCRNFCSQAGVIIADIDYVPAPVMRYPGQVYACYDVFQYFAAHASEWNADPARIALGGHSAGGNLTAAIVLMAIHENGAIPALQILDYAGFDMKTLAIEKRNGNSNPRIPAWKADFYNKMYVNPEDTEEIYCSPGLASDEDLAKMPPTIMIYCENDTFCDEAAEFHNRLLRQGVPVYGKRFLHSNHGFVVQRKGEYQEAERMIRIGLRHMM